VRGGLIDIFPMGSALPYRIELDDNLVESIRSFDADTQRSIYKVNEVRLLPAREFPLDEAAQARFRQSFRERFEGDPSRSRVYKDISKGVPSAGIEYYLPLFFEKTARITDYLPPETVIVTQGALAPAVEQFWTDTFARYTMLRTDTANPPLPPHDLFLTTDEFFGAIKPFSRVEIPAAAELRPETGDLRLEKAGREPTRATTHESPVSGPQSLVPSLQSPVSPLPPLAVERRRKTRCIACGRS
jgi:transcription-repair coupling factor (superfamily II helicase)